MAWIYFNNGPAIVDPAKLNSWFDSWVEDIIWKRTVNGEDVIQQIADRVSRHSHDIGKTTIRNTLRQLLHNFGPAHTGSREEGVRGALRDLLVQDIQMGQWSGTKKTRQTFMSLACLARVTESDRLAEALTGFLRQHVLHIVGNEKSGRYDEWIAALQELRRLEDDTTLDQLIAYFLRWSPMTRYNWSTQTPYDTRQAAKLAKDLLEAFEPSDYRSRRGKHLRPYSWPVRARSAPAYGYDRYIPDMRVGFPLPITFPTHRHRCLPPASPRIPLPLPRPSIEYPDDYDELRAEQDVQADEVDDLRWRVRRLELTH